MPPTSSQLAQKALALVLVSRISSMLENKSFRGVGLGSSLILGGIPLPEILV